MLDRVLLSDSKVPVLSLDLKSASVFEEFDKKRLRVATMDLRFAAIAMAHDLILLTRNIRDFSKVPGLLTEDWTALSGA
jgi:tRNA(fMet)-specific endonuclease VapC